MPPPRPLPSDTLMRPRRPQVATHALVYAQLVVNGQEHGLQTFMVQLRDEAFRLLPGIETGDLGEGEAPAWDTVFKVGKTVVLDGDITDTLEDTARAILTAIDELASLKQRLSEDKERFKGMFASTSDTSS